VYDQDIFMKGFKALLSHWDKCLNRGGEYIEK
jgi:hypothetical protein